MKTKKEQIIIFDEKKILEKQSNSEYLLLKDNNKMYYLYKTRTKETVLIGNNDAAELFILYGLNENKEEVKSYFKK